MARRPLDGRLSCHPPFFCVRSRFCRYISVICLSTDGLDLLETPAHLPRVKTLPAPWQPILPVCLIPALRPEPLDSYCHPAPVEQRHALNTRGCWWQADSAASVDHPELLIAASACMPPLTDPQWQTELLFPSVMRCAAGQGFRRGLIPDPAPGAAWTDRGRKGTQTCCI